MSHILQRRRAFAAALAGAAVASADEPKKTDGAKKQPHGGAPASKGPVEAAFARDYPEPGFKPRWNNPQLNRTLVADFVIYAHSELEMVKKLLAKEPKLLHAAMDWGAGDFETALGGASHMGRRDVVEFLLSQGARIDLFCAAMLGRLDAVKAFLTLEPKLIDAKGPHGISLHIHAFMGGEPAKPTLDYLQSVKAVKLEDSPFYKMKTKSGKKK
jgi:hypothetical protein